MEGGYRPCRYAAAPGTLDVASVREKRAEERFQSVGEGLGSTSTPTPDAHGSDTPSWDMTTIREFEDHFCF